MSWLSDTAEGLVERGTSVHRESGQEQPALNRALADSFSRSQRDAEIAQLWSHWQREHSIEVRNRLAEIFYPIVVLVARQMSSTLSDEISRDDIEGYATEGLLDAIERFDPSRGIQFSTFAPYRIRGAVYDRIREFDWVSRSDRRRERDLRQTREEFFLQHLRQPSLEEEAKLIGSTVGAHEGLIARLASSKVTSLQYSRRLDGTAVDVPDSEDGPLARLLSSELSGILRDALETLDPREQQVIRLTFVEEQSLSEVGRALGVTESRVCQIRARALRSLRRTLSNSGITQAREELMA